MGLVCALVLWASGPSAARAALPVESRLLVTFATDATASEREAALRAVDGADAGGIAALGVTRVIASAEAHSAAAILARQPGVRQVEVDGAVRLALTPNDTYYLSDPVTGLGEWGIRAARVDRAWDLARGNPDVIVAAVDTGVDASHPDLASAVLPPVSTMTGATPGCQIGAADDNSHGTHVAGVIGATGNNGAGIAGVAFGVRVLAIKALDCSGAGLVSDVAAAIVYAADHGARIVNISLGTPDDPPTLRNAVRYAQGKGVLVIAAAGNCGTVGRNCDGVDQPSYPAAYPGVLAVAATAPDDTIAPFSTHGSYIGIAAPGLKIISTTPTYPTFQSTRGQTLNYGVLSGTSQAAPFVAGVAALILSKDPSLSASQVLQRLQASADDLGAPGPDPVFGAGRVNALRAISAPGGTYGAVYDTANVPVSASTGATFSTTVKVTNTSSFSWPANGALRLAYHWSDERGQTVIWDGARSPLPAPLPINGSIDLPTRVIAPPDPGRYTLRFDMVNEGVTWFSGTGVPIGDAPVAVTSGFGAAYAITSPADTLKMSSVAPISVALMNTGMRTWTASGPQPVRLAYHWVAPSGFPVVWDGARAILPGDVPPGGSANVTLPVTTLPYGGGFVLRIDLVQEGVAWFSGQGVAPKDVGVTLVP